MIAKAFGILDIVAAVGISLFQFNVIPGSIALFIALYLLIKFVIFFEDFLSVIDGIIGLYILLMMLVKIEFVSYLFIVYLVIKGFVSMF